MYNISTKKVYFMEKRYNREFIRNNPAWKYNAEEPAARTDNISILYSKVLIFIAPERSDLPINARKNDISQKNGF